MRNFLYTNGGEWIQRLAKFVSLGETIPLAEGADYTVYTHILPVMERRDVTIPREWNAINELRGLATEVVPQVGLYGARDGDGCVVAGLLACDFCSVRYGN